MSKAHKFTRHYTRDEARALLPQVRQWLASIATLRQQLHGLDETLSERLAKGEDLGGEKVNRWITALADLKEVLTEFHRRQIQIKDIDRGLIDFPAIIGGREVFLCWEQDEDDIEFWHDLDAGYGGREKL